MEGESRGRIPSVDLHEVHERMQTKLETRIPKRFKFWAVLKTAFQFVISLYSLSFIMKSKFFVPGRFDATVWSKEWLACFYLPQAVFELGDLFVEVWMLSREKSREHMPWDSIMHHSAAASYGLYIYTYQDTLSHTFLGLACAALSCQFIGPLYTMYRLRYRFRTLGLLLLTVQLLYRCPLAVVSVIRAIQHFGEAPFAHFCICMVLAYLDFKWLLWSFKIHRRLFYGENKSKKKK
mmetsp:Transcript_8285/g.13417  ORF Transcript_8285/g.13417 Transcript_8285/m.13417 type:complete len:236 (-) Transcript_8285:4623-5330(-)